jgi:hypothetical protein
VFGFANVAAAFANTVSHFISPVPDLEFCLVLVMCNYGFKELIKIISIGCAANHCYLGRFIDVSQKTN